MQQQLIEQLKCQLHEFCGLVSVEELSKNEALVRVLERYARMLSAAGA